MIIIKKNIFYLLSSLVYIIFFLINRLYWSHGDANIGYLYSLKPVIGQKIYLHYSFQHGPYLNFFYDILHLLKVDSFYFLLVLGILQSLFAGYISILFSKHIIVSEFAKRICFLVTIFFFATDYNFFYWDVYVPLIGVYSLYLIFFSKKIIIGTFLVSLLFFLKQTFGLSFLAILIFIFFINFIFKKKKMIFGYSNFFFFKIFFIYLIFTLAHILIIFLFFDLEKFYFENFLMIFKFSTIYERNNIYNIFFNLFFLFPDIFNFKILYYHISDVKSFSQLSFYFLFRFPLFCFYFFLLINIKNFFKEYYLAFIIIILSIVLPLPLLGRGYWGTVYFFPTICCLIYFYLIEINFFKKKFLNIIKFLFIIYLFVIFIFNFLHKLQKINFDLNKDNIIKSHKYIFLNFQHKENFSSDYVISIKNMSNYLKKKNINEIFLLDTTSLSVLLTLPQVSLNKDVFYPSIRDSHFSWYNNFPNPNELFIDRFLNDFYDKSPLYVLYNKEDYLELLKFLPKSFLNQYKKDYVTNYFVLLKKLNYKIDLKTN
jgi:hypothetical protein